MDPPRNLSKGMFVGMVSLLREKEAARIEGELWKGRRSSSWGCGRSQCRGEPYSSQERNLFWGPRLSF